MYVHRKTWFTWESLETIFFARTFFLHEGKKVLHLCNQRWQLQMCSAQRVRRLGRSWVDQPAAGVSMGPQCGPIGGYGLCWSAGGKAHVARSARCLREERGRCGPYDLCSRK